MRRIARRKFFSSSLGAMMATRAFGSVAAGTGTPAKHPIGTGIIGTAHPHAVGHLRSIRRSESYQLLGVAESKTDLLAQAKTDSRWSGVPWVTVDSLLADERIQLVCIETDPLEALEYAHQAVLADKHTKIDKPPGSDFKALKEIFREAQRRNRVLQMGYVYRYNLAFRLAHRAIREGWLGPIRSAVCQMNDRLSAAGRRRLDRYPGGQMFEICGHMIDALIWLLGEPARVSSVLRHSDPAEDELEDDVLAMLEFEPAVAVVKSHTRDGNRYFYVFGQEGSIQIDSPDRPQVRLALSAPHGEFGPGVHQVPLGPSQRYLPDLDDLAGAIRENRWVEFFTPEHDLAVQHALLTACGLKL
ncbi:Gfo/Idh/MocA family oxidoreductase [Acidobacteria bacterium AH-259-G07]|nr:Gfo/Idh/MocA family oxidoreductase [Acidobacteria bacterium AH-259-G07]